MGWNRTAQKFEKTGRRTSRQVLPIKKNPQATEILTHELLVHKVELEMQNEELRRANISMEEARDRYVDFYEFSPVSFITLDQAGMISEINLTGSSLFGIERYRLISRRLSNYVNLQHKDRWNRLFINIMKQPELDKHAFDLEMVRADGSTFHAYLNCVKRHILGSAMELRIALTDISNLECK